MTARVRLVRFWGVGLLGFVVQLATITGLADGLGVPVALSTVAGVSAALVHNFVWHRQWTWADRRRDATTALAFARFVTANGVVSFAGNVAITAGLASWLAVPTVAANTVAVIACSLVNFCLGDAVVFRPVGRPD